MILFSIVRTQKRPKFGFDPSRPFSCRDTVADNSHSDIRSRLFSLKKIGSASFVALTAHFGRLVSFYQQMLVNLISALAFSQGEFGVVGLDLKELFALLFVVTLNLLRDVKHIAKDS